MLFVCCLLFVGCVVVARCLFVCLVFVVRAFVCLVGCLFVVVGWCCCCS